MADHQNNAVGDAEIEDNDQDSTVIPNNAFTRQPSLPTRSASGKRLIYCSDGVIEESDSDSMDSSDAEQEMEAAETRSEVPDPVTYAPQWAVEADPKRLGWKHWFAYKAVWFGIGSLHCAEVAGEKFAWLFGITSPKYSWEIEEYRRQRRAAKEERRIEQEENDKVQEIVMRNMALSGGLQSTSADSQKSKIDFTDLATASVASTSVEKSTAEESRSHIGGGAHENYAFAVEDETCASKPTDS